MELNVIITFVNTSVWCPKFDFDMGLNDGDWTRQVQWSLSASRGQEGSGVIWRTTGTSLHFRPSQHGKPLLQLSCYHRHGAVAGGSITELHTHQATFWFHFVFVSELNNKRTDTSILISCTRQHVYGVELRRINVKN